MFEDGFTQYLRGFATFLTAVWKGMLPRTCNFESEFLPLCGNRLSLFSQSQGLKHCLVNCSMGMGDLIP